MPVLDTTFLIGLEKRPGTLRHFLEDLNEEGEPILVPVQAAIEFAAGADDPAQAIRTLQEAFTVVPFGPVLAIEAARLARASFASGKFPGWPDIQIAATARHEGMVVVTRNGRHFETLGIRVRPHP